MMLKEGEVKSGVKCGKEFREGISFQEVSQEMFGGAHLLKSLHPLYGMAQKEVLPAVKHRHCDIKATAEHRNCAAMLKVLTEDAQKEEKTVLPVGNHNIRQDRMCVSATPADDPPHGNCTADGLPADKVDQATVIRRVERTCSGSSTHRTDFLLRAVGIHVSEESLPGRKSNTDKFAEYCELSKHKTSQKSGTRWVLPF